MTDRQDIRTCMPMDNGSAFMELHASSWNFMHLKCLQPKYQNLTRNSFLRSKIIKDNVYSLNTKFYINLIFSLVTPPCKAAPLGAWLGWLLEVSSLSQTI